MNLKNSIFVSLLFLTAFAAALLGLNPSFYMDDSPETITVSTVLGIDHPPGYPLFTLLGRIFSQIPLSQFSFRVNLLSACLASLACVLLFFLLQNCFKVTPTLAAAFSLSWMVGATLYPSALSAKTGIYQLAAVFLISILLSLFQSKPWLAFFLWGLSLDNHWMSMAAYAPGLILLTRAWTRSKSWSIREWLTAFTFTLIGLSLYLSLPLRAALEPVINWGNPVSLKNFINHVTRYGYHRDEMGGNPFLWLGQVWFYLKDCFFEFGGIGLFALVGIWAAWKKNQVRTMGLLLSWMILVAAISLLNLSPNGLLRFLEDYSLSTYVFIILFSALGFQYLLYFSEKTRSMEKTIGALAFALALLAVGYRFTESRQTFYTYTYDYVLNAWKSVPRNGLFFCKGDVLNFPAWYLQFLQGKRKDIPVLGAGTLPMDWYRIRLAHDHPGLKVPFPRHEPGKEYISGPLFQWMVQNNPGQALYFTYPDLFEDGLKEIRLAPHGLVQEGFLAPTRFSFDESQADRLWQTMRLRHYEKPDRSVDNRSWNNFLKDYGMARLWMVSYLSQQAAALQALPGKKLTPAQHQQARALYARSLPHLLWAQAWDLENPTYALKVGVDYFYMGRIQEAESWFEKAALIDPNYADAYYYGGVLAFQVGNSGKAKSLFQKALGLNPQHILAYQALQYLNK